MDITITQSYDVMIPKAITETSIQTISFDELFDGDPPPIKTEQELLEYLYDHYYDLEPDNKENGEIDWTTYVMNIKLPANAMDELKKYLNE